jgi:hypothetical protein
MWSSLDPPHFSIDNECRLKISFDMGEIHLYTLSLLWMIGVNINDWSQQNFDFNSHSLNKTSTLIVLICFQGGGNSYEPLEPPLATGVWLPVCCLSFQDNQQFHDMISYAYTNNCWSVSTSIYVSLISWKRWHVKPNYPVKALKMCCWFGDLIS